MLDLSNGTLLKHLFLKEFSFLHKAKNHYFCKKNIMTEIIFIVEDSPEGGFEAKALGHSIFTEGETIEQLKQNIREAIQCHFEKNIPKIVRLHYIKEEVFAA